MSKSCIAGSTLSRTSASDECPAKLIFVGSGGDGYVHAFDKDTGKILWETELEGNPDGIPAVYEVAGRQYVAFFARGGGGDGIVTRATKPESQGYYVFALPDSDSKPKKRGD